MLCLFVDDSTHTNATRPGLGPVVALGGVLVPEDQLKPLSDALDSLCVRYGFPPGEEFKWSPNRKKHWMWKNLQGPKRAAFFREVLFTAKIFRASSLVVVVSLNPGYQPAIPGNTPEQDALTMLLERANSAAMSVSATCRVIIDNPGGNHKNLSSMKGQCANVLSSGTAFSKLLSLSPNVEFATSHSTRLLQLADIVVSCTTARVSGEATYSPPVFQAIRPLFRKGFGGRTGGIGIKIHPCKYVNLYHWLLGDTNTKIGTVWHLLPTPNRPYFEREGCDSADIA
jgi:hypothetical protein